MRLVLFHVDSFTCTITEKGRSPLVEPPAAPSMRIEEGLLVLANAEAGDESAPDEVVASSAQEVQTLASKLKVEQVMVLPFAHLFAEPAPPAEALAMLDSLADALRTAGLHVQRPPFGWFHRGELDAKCQPLSRVARHIRPPVAHPAAPGS